MIVVKSAIKKIVFISIVLISTLMHLKHFNKELVSIHVWRQTQTQTTINNFYEESMNIFKPLQNSRGNTEGVLRMEFPLMQWTVACLYKIFGNHLIISRIFMFITGLFSVVGIFYLLKKLFQNEILALIGCWAFNFSPSFYYHTINPLPDNFSLALGIWGLVFFFKYYQDKKTLSILLCGILLSLSALCKLPFIIFYVPPVLFFFQLFFKREKSKLFVFQFFLFSAPILLPIAWYLSVIPDWGGNVIIKGILNENGLKTILSYISFNLYSTLPEMLINYGSVLFFLLGLFYFLKRRAYKDKRSILLIGLGIVCLLYYIFESTAIGNVHDYYLFPFYPLLFILVAYGAYYFYSSTIRWQRVVTVFLLSILPLTCFLRMKDRWDTVSPGFNKDLLVYKNELRGAVPKKTLVVAGNDESSFIFLYYIDKKGWTFDNDNLNKELLTEMIRNGAEYLYSDSEKINKDPGIHELFEGIAFEKNSIKIYKLRKL